MMESGQQVSGAVASANKRTIRKISDANNAIERLLERGSPVDFQTVAIEANCSRVFLYNNAELRERIEELREDTAGFVESDEATSAAQRKISSLEYRVEQKQKGLSTLQDKLKTFGDMLFMALRHAEEVATNPETYPKIGGRTTNAEAEERLYLALEVLKECNIKPTIFRLQALTQLSVDRIRSFMAPNSGVFQHLGTMMQNPDAYWNLKANAPFIPHDER